MNSEEIKNKRSLLVKTVSPPMLMFPIPFSIKNFYKQFDCLEKNPERALGTIINSLSQFAFKFEKDSPFNVLNQKLMALNSRSINLFASFLVLTIV